MFPFFRNNTSTPTERKSGINKESSTDSRNEVENSFYFSRLFSSPVSQNTNIRSPSSPSHSLRRSTAVHRDIPPSLFNFQSPIHHRHILHSPRSVPSRPRNAIEFLSHSNSSMMERAIRVLESKRQQKRSNEYDDGGDSEGLSLKRYRSNEENNSSPLLDESITVALPQESEEVIPRPKLRPTVSSSTRPSSSKLPDRVSCLSSATLEALAFGVKRRRSDEENIERVDRSSPVRKRYYSVVSMLDDNFVSSTSPPASKRRAMRDCETQTIFQTDNATSTADKVQPKRSPLSIRPAATSSVSRFIAGLEARARANALSRRLAATAASPISIQSPSLEDRHANIRRMFADLTEKAEAGLMNVSSRESAQNKVTESKEASGKYEFYIWIMFWGFNAQRSHLAYLA